MAKGPCDDLQVFWDLKLDEQLDDRAGIARDECIPERAECEFVCYLTHLYCGCLKFVRIPHSRYGLVTCRPSQGWLCELASSASFSPQTQLKLRGSDFYPGGSVSH